LENIPRDGAIVLAANHVGEQDGLLIASAVVPYLRGRKIFTIAKWKILSFPLWKKWLGTITLYADGQKTLQIALEHLRRGQPVLVFPEAGVNTKPIIGKIKTGAARLALMTRTPIIPIGLRRITPPPKSELGFIWEILAGRLEITIGTPINLSNWYDKPIDRTVLDDTDGLIMSTIARLANKTYLPHE
jgi:1-acyl-sn-glycerol-3-phosphate acyltransferase